MESIIERLSVKYELPKVAIEAIVKSMFGFTADVMRRGDMENVMLLYLGKFCVKPGKKKFVLKKRLIIDMLNEKERLMNEQNPGDIIRMDQLSIQE